jgi:hypothetical protein
VRERRARRAGGCYDSGPEDTRISDRPPSAEASTPPAHGAAKPQGRRTLGLISFLVELVLPVTLAGGLLLVVAGQLSFWNLRSAAGLAVFCVLVVALSLLLSVKIDGITLARRQKDGKRRLLNRANPRARLVKFVLGGLLVPLAALYLANRLELPGHRTPMELVIEAGTTAPTASVAERLGAAVVRAPAPQAKLEGVRALQAVHSSEALDQLLRIVRDDRTVLRDEGVRAALAKALASFGAAARAPLVERFNAVAVSERSGAAGPPGGLFERCFAADFEALATEIRQRTPDAAAQAVRIARVEAARADLRRTLGEIEAEAPPAGDAGLLPAFIMEVLLEMDMKHDDELLAFGRAVAADAGWSDAVRGQALLLVAKLGGSDDLPGLLDHLDDHSAVLQTRALQAIAVLEARLAAAPK